MAGITSISEKSEQMLLESCSVVVWDVDIVGEEAMTVFYHLWNVVIARFVVDERSGSMLKISVHCVMGLHVPHGLKKIRLT